jgi:hypothetical protein
MRIFGLLYNDFAEGTTIIYWKEGSVKGQYGDKKAYMENCTQPDL